MAASQDDDHDLDLVLRIMDGDARALRDLAAAYHPRIIGFLRRVYGPGITGMYQIAEDAFQMAMTRVWRHLDTYEPDHGPVGPWLLRIAQHCAIDIMKREPRFVPLLEDEDSRARVPTAITGNPFVLATNEIIAALPPQQRYILTADLAHGSSADAAALAKELGTSPGAVRVQRSKAWTKVRAELKKRRLIDDKERPST